VPRRPTDEEIILLIREHYQNPGLDPADYYRGVINETLQAVFRPADILRPEFHRALIAAGPASTVLLESNSPAVPLLPNEKIRIIRAISLSSSGAVDPEGVQILYNDVSSGAVDRIFRIATPVGGTEDMLGGDNLSSQAFAAAILPLIIYPGDFITFRFVRAVAGSMTMTGRMIGEDADIPIRNWWT